MLSSISGGALLAAPNAERRYPAPASKEFEYEDEDEFEYE
jgi:hypothetical protein